MSDKKPWAPWLSSSAECPSLWCHGAEADHVMFQPWWGTVDTLSRIMKSAGVFWELPRKCHLELVLWVVVLLLGSVIWVEYHLDFSIIFKFYLNLAVLCVCGGGGWRQSRYLAEEQRTEVSLYMVNSFCWHDKHGFNVEVEKVEANWRLKIVLFPFFLFFF